MRAIRQERQMLGSLTLGRDGTGDFPARRGCPNPHHRAGRDEASHPSAKASRRRKAKRQRMARSSRRAFPKGDLRGFSDAWRAYLAKASPFSDAWRANLAANWRFSRPRPLSGCMERKTCHGLPPGNAFREHFANGAASSCGRVYCLAIALVPHESDDLFVQAVLCT